MARPEKLCDAQRIEYARIFFERSNASADNFRTVAIAVSVSFVAYASGSLSEKHKLEFTGGVLAVVAFALLGLSIWCQKSKSQDRIESALDAKDLSEIKKSFLGKDPKSQKYVPNWILDAAAAIILLASLIVFAISKAHI